MKKRSLITTLLVITILSLTGCAGSKNLASMTSYSAEGTGAVNVIEWDGVQYYYFGVGGDQFIGEQIGIVNGDKDDRVYAADGYDTGAWIIEKYYSGEMDNAVIYKEKSVTDIPAELIYNTKFLTEEHFEFVKNLCNEIVEKNGQKF